MKRNLLLQRILLILSIIIVIILAFILTYLLVKFPLKTFVDIDWIGDPTISDYGQLVYTKFLVNNSFKLCGIILIVDTILITRISKIENKHLEHLLIVSSLGMLGVGLIPIPITYQPFLDVIHWMFGAFALLGFPILTALVIRQTYKRLGNFFLVLISGGIMASLYVFFYHNYQKMHGEVIMGIITLALTIVLNLLYIRKIENKLKAFK